MVTNLLFIRFRDFDEGVKLTPEEDWKTFRFNI